MALGGCYGKWAARHFLHLVRAKALRRWRLESLLCLGKMRAELLNTWPGSDLMVFTPQVCSPSNLYRLGPQLQHSQFLSFFLPGAIKYNTISCPSQERSLSSKGQSISHSFHVTQHFTVVLRLRPPPFHFFFLLLLLNRKSHLRNPWVQKNN